MLAYLVISVENSIYLEYPPVIHNNHVKLCSSSCDTLLIYVGSVVTTHSTVQHSYVRIVAPERIELSMSVCKTEVISI